MRFDELDLEDEVLDGIDAMNFQEMTPVQEQTIQIILAGREIIACAQTGTGKTCAFGVPILQRLAAQGHGKPIRALILTPTRELAIQIDDNLHAYGKHLPLTEAVIFGGVGQAPQVERLKNGVDILVATPGRLGDL